VTKDEIIEFVTGLPGTVGMTASEDNGAPEAAWGDSFFYFDPSGDVPTDRQPFATVVIKDYDGFDTASDLNRDGVFRVNMAVGRKRFEELIGHPPAAHADHHGGFDYTATDRLLPHPVYAAQGWVCVLNPGAATGEQVLSLLKEAHALDAERFDRRNRHRS
jgi:hypothetical protein